MATVNEWARKLYGTFNLDEIIRSSADALKYAREYKDLSKTIRAVAASIIPYIGDELEPVDAARWESIDTDYKRKIFDELTNIVSNEFSVIMNRPGVETDFDADALMQGIVSGSDKIREIPGYFGASTNIRTPQKPTERTKEKAKERAINTTIDTAVSAQEEIEGHEEAYEEPAPKIEANTHDDLLEDNKQGIYRVQISASGYEPEEIEMEGRPTEIIRSCKDDYPDATKIELIELIEEIEDDSMGFSGEYDPEEEGGAGDIDVYESTDVNASDVMEAITGTRKSLPK